MEQDSVTRNFHLTKVCCVLDNIRYFILSNIGFYLSNILIKSDRVLNSETTLYN